MTVLLGAFGCSSEDSPSAGKSASEPTPTKTVASPTVSEPTESKPSKPSKPKKSSSSPGTVELDPSKLSKWERTAIAQLRAIGVTDAHPVEIGFRGAELAGHDHGDFVAVSTSVQDIEYEAEVARTEQVGGVAVNILRFGKVPDAVGFTCGGTQYMVQKVNHPEGSGPVDIEATEALVERLIHSLDCS